MSPDIIVPFMKAKNRIKIKTIYSSSLNVSEANLKKPLVTSHLPKMGKNYASIMLITVLFS